jgi:hypothetical protein
MSETAGRPWRWFLPRSSSRKRPIAPMRPSMLSEGDEMLRGPWTFSIDAILLVAMLAGIVMFIGWLFWPL